VCTKWQFCTEYNFGGKLQMPKNREKMVSQFPGTFFPLTDYLVHTRDSSYDDMEKF
jgi:hypothetical protein